ncbi:MAG: phasin family protein [Pseudomonas sp.]
MTTTNRNQDPQAEEDGIQAQASRFSSRLGKSAEQVWLAGLGALNRAQSEGTRLFESLVKEGESYQSENRRQSEAGVETARDRAETRFDQAREKASENWQRLGKAFDERVKNVLHTLQLPDREEIQALRTEIESLKAQLHATQVRTSPVSPTPATPNGDSPASTAPPAGAD